jgi:serine/threonine protein phosphatase PrpC
VLWDQADGGVDFALSLDHKPSRRAEKRRIEALGGRITYFGVPRVNGVLAVSRAIGDSAYKRFIISDPEQRSCKGACLSSIIADQTRTLHAKIHCPVLGFGSLARDQQTCFSLDEIICSR